MKFPRFFSEKKEKSLPKVVEQGKEVVPVSEEYYDLDLISQKKGLEIYKRMKLDDQVRACSGLKKAIILSQGFRIEAPNTPEGQEQKKFVEENLSSSNLGKSITTKIKGILSAFDYGFSVTEIVWQLKEGKVYLKDLKTKPPFDCEFLFDEYGNILPEGVRYRNENYRKDKFIIYTFDPEFDNPYGNSDFQSAYPSWWFKQTIWRFWASHLEEYGSPVKVGKYPENATKKQKSEFEEIIKTLHHGSAVMLPMTSNKEEQFLIEYLETKKQSGNIFESAMESADTRIARALLFPRLFGLTKESFGSYALGKEQFAVVYTTLTQIQKEVAEEITIQLIRRLLSYNFPKVEDVRFKFLPPRYIDVATLVNLFLNLRKEGVVKERETDEENFRTILNI